ncbi:M60 family metallopeptidase [Stieleria maiorica]|nr:M60 family metallopeptidase [Stieleria maiorica]
MKPTTIRAWRKVALEQLETRIALASDSGLGIYYERYDDIPGASVADLVAAEAFPDSPDATAVLDQFEAPENVGDFYGFRMRALLHPPKTGHYTFWIASGDGSELRLSTSDSEQDSALIASVPGWTLPREWDKYAEQQSASVFLAAGQEYYIEARVKEWYGGDYGAVAWSGPIVGAPTIISGGYLSPVGAAIPQPTDVLVDDIATTASGQAVDFNVLLNDVDHSGGGDSRTIILGSAENGQVTVVDHGTVRYSPNAGFAGIDSFSYTVTKDSAVIGQATATVYVNAILEESAVRAKLLDGVKSLVDAVQPGEMVVFGPTALSVANYPGKGLDSPMIAASTLGQGRVVAVSDHQWLLMGQYGNDPSMRAFYKNGLSWLAQSEAKEISIVVYAEDPNRQAVVDETLEWLESEGYSNVTTANNAALADALQTADLFLTNWMGRTVPPEVVSTLVQFASNGGGLFLGDYGVGYDWWWNKETTEIPGNQILRAAGIGYVKDSPNSGAQAVSPAVGRFTKDDLAGVLSGERATVDPEAIREVFRKVNEVLPESDTLQKTLDRLAMELVMSVSPTPSSPVTDSIDKMLLAREMELLLQLPAEEMPAHRTAASVYGEIQAGAPRLTEQTVSLPTNKSGWVATGFYAAPGETVEIDFPVQLVNKGFSVIIGSHTDSLDKYASTRAGQWRRVPFGTSIRREIDQPRMKLAAPMGGSIFVDFIGNGWGEPLNIGNVEITVHGALRTPSFTLGDTTDEEWINDVRNQPGLYAEFNSEHLAFSVPASWVRDLANPTELMMYWDEVVSYMDWLAGYDDLRTGPERINLDVQISIGLLHAGYPIQGPTGYGDSIVDLEHLRSVGDWGWFHELGHEMQWPDSFRWKNPYTFDGDSEVTVNIFANAALEKMASDFENAEWGWSAIEESVMSEAVEQTHAGTPASFDEKANPYPFYYQLADGPWGWEGVASVLRTYVDDFVSDPRELPNSNQERKDEWLIRFSESVGYDLTSYMVDHWGLEVTPAAIEIVSDMNLPGWLPITAGRDRYLRFEHSSAEIPVDQIARTLDGDYTVVSYSQPTSGSVKEDGNGNFRYVPDPTSASKESFSVNLQSSAGNIVSLPIDISVAHGRGVLMERYGEISGLLVDDLLSSNRYPAYPSSSEVVPSFQSPAISKDRYGLRMRAYLTPPTTGAYTLWIASDDQGELHLSSSSAPNDARVVAYTPSAVTAGEWERYDEQQSPAIELEAGRRYYIEALMKEQHGRDFLQIAWTPPGETTPAIIREEYLTPFGIVENEKPEAVDDVAVVDWNSSIVVAPLQNDRDLDESDSLEIISIDQPASGNLEQLESGEFRYTPASNQSGSEILSYTISDGEGGYDTSTLRFEVVAPSALGQVSLLSEPLVGSAVHINSVFVESTTPAQLDGWIDFDRNGVFDHPAEHIGQGQSFTLESGVNLLPFKSPRMENGVSDVRAKFVLSVMGDVKPSSSMGESVFREFYVPAEDSVPPDLSLQLSIPTTVRSSQSWKVADHGNSLRIFGTDNAVFEITEPAAELDLDLRGAIPAVFVGKWGASEPIILDDSTSHSLVSPSGRITLRNDTPWTNPVLAFDVNRDGVVTPIDALGVINFIASHPDTTQLSPPTTLRGFAYVDVSADQTATPLDALRVINHIARTSTTTQQSDWSSLVTGVSQIVWSGAAGPLIDTADNWVAIASGDEDSSPLSVVAAARDYGAGKIVALGHEGLFGAYTMLDNAQFLRNTFRYLGADQNKTVGFSTGHSEWLNSVDHFSAIQDDLTGEGFVFEPVHGALTSQSLASVSTLVVGNAWSEFAPEEIEAIRSFVESGGSLFLGGLGWSWNSYHPDQTMDDYPMIDIAAPFQLRWHAESISDPTDQHLGHVVFHTFYPEASFTQ